LSTAAPEVSIGVDIGGTFTDVIAVAGERIGVAKVLSTPADLSQGVIDGISQVLGDVEAAPGEVGAIVHATTATTNALLENKGGVVGLLVTDGFGDILEIARQRRPDAYDLFAEKPPALVERERVVEIPERLRADGTAVTDLDEDAVRAAWAKLEPLGVEAIAIAFLHSYVDPRHERRAAEILAEAVPAEVPIFASHTVLAEAREFERTSTTVIAAYLSNITRGYQATLADRLEGLGAPRRFWVMKSSGGLVTSERAANHPEELVESGPAAGVIASAGASRRLGLGDVLSFDMGGTTAKASLVLGGAPRLTWDYEVGGSAHSGGFLTRGGGHPLRVPVVDLTEVGTGGGSIAWIDPAGALRVGPRSAGADPGPACYGRGGENPTVTDADVVLGYVGSSGAKSDLGDLDVEAAREAIETKVAGPLGMSVEEAAEGIFALANAQMAAAVRLVSMAKGYDPREFALLAFGGAGPVRAWAVARELDIANVIVPPFAGVNSAVGLLEADFRVDLSRGQRAKLEDPASRELVGGILAELGAEARAELHEQGLTDEEIEISYAADVRYYGQSYDVLVDFPAGPEDFDGLAAAFHAAHATAYGHSHPGDPLEATVLRVSATAPGVGFALRDSRSSGERAAGHRDVRFDGTEVEAVVLRREDLGTERVPGPALIEENETTIVVPPGAAASADESGFITLELKGGAA
jgi:N-methylhydantoinase A